MQQRIVTKWSKSLLNPVIDLYNAINMPSAKYKTPKTDKYQDNKLRVPLLFDIKL